MTLIAISGKRRSGKSTLGDLLANKYRYIPRSLATPLKKMCRHYFDLSFDQTDGFLKETVDTRYNMTPRQIMINMGAFYRSIDQDFWVKQLFSEFKDIPEIQLRTVVVTDVRFQNEMEWMKKHNAYKVRLERDEKYTGANIQDPSETELDSYTEWDYVLPVDKNRALIDLDHAAEQIHAQLLERV